MVNFNKARKREPAVQELNESTGKIVPKSKLTSTKLPLEVINKIKMSAIKLGLTQTKLLEANFLNLLSTKEDIQQFPKNEYPSLVMYRFSVREDIKKELDLSMVEHQLKYQDILYHIYRKLTTK